MRKIEIFIRNTENIDRMTDLQLIQCQEVVTALISSGGLTGVKGGKTMIHFDAEGIFQGIELSYWPWRKRKNS